MSEPLPEVTEITRWEYRPGDRLIAHTDEPLMSREQALEIAGEIRRRLRLPAHAPVIIAGKGWTFEVLSEVD